MYNFTFVGKGNDEEGKAKVSRIHEMKEKLKQENDVLKKLKQQLKDVQEKQKNEKEVNGKIAASIYERYSSQLIRLFVRLCMKICLNIISNFQYRKPKHKVLV